MAVAFTLAARMGDVLQMHASNMVLKEGRLKYTFVRGKTVEFTGKPFTVVTTVQEDFMEAIKGMEDIPKDKFLWHFNSSKDRQDCLTQFNKLCLTHLGIKATSKGIRRGSIQHMSKMGATPQQIMAITGHTNPETVMIYLDHGRQDMAKVAQSTMLGALLCADELQEETDGSDEEEN
jgi:integrase